MSDRGWYVLPAIVAWECREASYQSGLVASRSIIYFNYYLEYHNFIISSVKFICNSDYKLNIA